jgi:hypothetical protein
MMALLQPEAADYDCFPRDLISSPNLNRTDRLPRDQGARGMHDSV